jgi:hypothetical protein
MAAKSFFHDIDLNKSSLLQAKFQVLSTASRLALSLVTSDKGFVVWDTDILKLFIFDGTAWVTWASPVVGTLIYQGLANSLTVAPTTTTVGSVYVSSISGNVTWAGITLSPNSTVGVGDMIIFSSSTTADIVEGNNIVATTTQSGNISLATNAEVITGTDASKAVVSSSLSNYVTSKAFAKTYFISGLTTVANTALTVTHNLNLQNKDAFVISVKDSSGSEISVDVDSVNTQSCTITAGVGLTGISVTVIGF